MILYRELGQFCWLDVKTSDIEVTKRFFHKLLGWDFQSEVIAERVYTKIQIGKHEVGGLTNLKSPVFPPGTLPHISFYVAVESVDMTAARVSGLGGKIILEPFDVPGSGRMATIEDPLGGVLSLWEARSFLGVNTDQGQIGAPGWFELLTTDPMASAEFYTELLGWEQEVREPYILFHCRGQAVGGITRMSSQWEGMNTQWMVHFTVKDVEEIIAKAQNLGVRVVIDIQDHPIAGKYTGMLSPDGLLFAIHRYNHNQNTKETSLE
ncbi:VOC family protein [Desmospora activa]|uniref:VOC domain-containing protein n=1 Tax=Desmospora activa DSM 45169 TaxID=1121389 RepID=A0A2T4Z8I7_9BACL|nr:VOC family protein [Desmospora activa]PTM58202.1 hypothetical protein C8J48_0780 [Desmospora activa DSM 45169]